MIMLIWADKNLGSTWKDMSRIILVNYQIKIGVLHFQISELVFLNNSYLECRKRKFYIS